MINKVILVGNVGNDPEIKSLPSGSKVANFSLATSESRKDKEGNKVDRTEWHRLVVYNENIVNIIEKYVKKGTKLYIEGSIRYRKYTDSSGVEKNIAEVVIQGYNDVLKFMDSKNSEGGFSGNKDSSSSPSKPYSASSSDEGDIDDEIPF